MIQNNGTDNQTCHSFHPTISPYHAGAITAILDLTRTTLGNTGATRKTEAFWHWKHQANPFGPSYGLYAWDEAPQIVAGLRVLLRWKFNSLAGQPILAVRAVDTATHPAYQRRAFSTLTRQAVHYLEQAGVDIFFNTPNQSSLPGLSQDGLAGRGKMAHLYQNFAARPMLATLLRRRTAVPAAIYFDHYFAPGIISWATFVGQYGEAIGR